MQGSGPAPSIIAVDAADDDVEFTDDDVASVKALFTAMCEAVPAPFKGVDVPFGDPRLFRLPTRYCLLSTFF